MVTSKHFVEKEFQNCSPACSLQDMKQCTITKLDKARDVAGIPFVLTSAYRSPAWDKARGRTGTGSHTTRNAVDIRCNSETNRWKVVSALIEAGFNRIGIAKTYVHADDSGTHSINVIWLY
jgi:uncharacterized protein YcbK (DUF882 family)